MSTFVLLTPDAFNQRIQQVSGDLASDRSLTTQGLTGGTGAYDQVRRPTRGIQIKRDTYATLQVRTADGRAIPLFDAGSSKNGMSDIDSNFLIQQIQEQRAEKQQIVLTFGTPYIFFFGEQPRTLNVTGVLLNTEDFNWRAEWWENYDRYLRGTQCVRSRARVYLSWDDIVVEGYILSANASETTTEQHYVPFSFQMFLTNYQNISNIGDSFAHLGHLASLNPAELGSRLEADLANNPLYQSLGQGSSTTRAVLAANQALALGAGTGKDSLLDSLRNDEVLSALSHGTSRLAEINGQIVDILAEAGRFVAGRNIRVPLGFEGSAVFGDAQVALATIAPEIITGQARTISISRELAGKSFTLQYDRGRRTSPAHYGGLFENTDEFVARSTPAAGRAVQVPELYATQQADDLVLAEQVRATFRAFGVDVEPPDEAQLLARRMAFGVISLAGGLALNQANTDSDGWTGFGLNLVGSL